MVYLQILGAAPGSSPSVYLCTRFKRYLFNAGEGIQRFCAMHRVRLVRLADVFLTGLSIRQFGGVPGLFMTLADIDSFDSVTLHGPVHTDAVVAAARSFASNPQHTLQAHVIDAHGREPVAVLNDDEVSVQAIAFSPRRSPRKRIRDIDDADVDLAAAELLSTPNGDAHTPCIVAYIVRLADLPGKFDPAKARGLGLKPGPDFAGLIRGEPATTDDGRVVQPCEVVGPPRPGRSFIIVDCPTVDHVALLGDVARHAPHLAAVVHLTPDDVSATTAYRSWQAGTFPTGVQHLRCSATINLDTSATFAPSNAVHTMLHRVCPEAFPLARPALPDMSPLTHAMARFQFPPNKTTGLLLDDVPSAIPTDAIDKHLAGVDGVGAAIREAHDAQSLATSGESPELTFLGTGAAAPSKYRNSSGIDLMVPGSGRILLDCGEGVLGQIVRAFDDLPGYLRSLRCVWISHKHADHHVGLVSLLRAHRQYADAPLLVVAPVQVRQWVRQFLSVSPDRVHCHLADVTDAPDLSSWLRTHLQITSMTSVPVLHCRDSFGIVLTHERGWKFVYSGDTRPCPALIDAGAGATVLVHEATFDDELADEAVLKRHSTMSEALAAGRAMGAQDTILTHFSQRYAKVPKADGTTRPPCVAFDLMRVRFDRLHVLPSTLVAVDLLLNDNAPKLTM
ncbi:unnamed protein product (mitochondrion) [Plasmodiophora brassicae]|uniref:ribonuclease Z n=1 Tax=Plasmodiophora brassicae TaxID=37360 RepID=A0A0G4IK68_PLABS|nr:hypothetical protein PBRA_004241 [Plasmodiophora brassicae]SPR00388.1 unnamed protein product [Plasmodiophora brassicae]